MRTLPLHHSQKEIYACDDYADFELTLRPTYNFYMKLMSFGNMIKVLEPKSLQEKICKWLDKTIEVYKLNKYGIKIISSLKSFQRR